MGPLKRRRDHRTPGPWARLVTLGVLVGGCEESPAPVIPSSGVDGVAAVRSAPAPDRYTISEGSRRLGVVAQQPDGQLVFTPDPGLPKPCRADTLASDWATFDAPQTVTFTRERMEDGGRIRASYGVTFGRTDGGYPQAVVADFSRKGYALNPSFSFEIGDGGKVVEPPRERRYEVVADGGENGDDHTDLPLGVFMIASDGQISLTTACEGEYLQHRLTKHLAQDELVLGFREPNGKWSMFESRKPGDLRLSSSDHPDVQISYRRGDPEFFAALMTIVDHQFMISLDVDPEPVLSASAG